MKTNKERIAEEAMLMGLDPEGDYHTYVEWQNLGRQVTKGEKAIMKTTLIIRKEKHTEDGHIEVYYFQKEAALFSREQTHEKQVK